MCAFSRAPYPLSPFLKEDTIFAMTNGPDDGGRYLEVKHGVGKRKGGLLLGVTVHEFMLISICQCLCHLMIVSWSHGFVI